MPEEVQWSNELKLLELTELHCGATVDKLGENPFFTHDF